MPTVYEFDGYRFTKDLVFGWSIIGETIPFPVNQMGLVGIQALLNLWPFPTSLPAYIPEEFMQSIRSRKEELVKEKEAKASDTGATTLSVKKDNVTWTEVGPRDKDRAKLLAEILEKMRSFGPQSLSADLSYGVVTRQINVNAVVTLLWSFTPKSDQLPKQIFDTVDDLATWVLKTYW